MLSRSSHNAWRSELRPGNLVNPGIGIPTLVANYVPPDIKLFFQSEEQGMAHSLLIDAGGRSAPCPAHPPRQRDVVRPDPRRHVDVTVLGALQVDAEAPLANWMIPGKMAPGMGGARDFVSGAKRVIVAMQHGAKGKSKIVRKVPCR
jgi:acetate CoA/acetoacetate CoA-transferase beta subunit